MKRLFLTAILAGIVTATIIYLRRRETRAILADSETMAALIEAEKEQYHEEDLLPPSVEEFGDLEDYRRRRDAAT